MDIFAKTAQILKNPRQRVLAGIFILLIAIILIFSLTYYYTQAPRSNIEPSTSVLGLLDEQDPRYYYEQDQVYSYNGRIKEVKDDYLFFEATYFQDHQIVQSVIKATFGEETVFVKKDLDKLYQLGPENFETAFAPAKSEDLKEGSQVQIFSNQDIKYRLEFPASKIEIIYQSQAY